jgi:hypothetical protein
MDQFGARNTASSTADQTQPSAGQRIKYLPYRPVSSNDRAASERPRRRMSHDCIDTSRIEERAWNENLRSSYHRSSNGGDGQIHFCTGGVQDLRSSRQETTGLDGLLDVLRDSTRGTPRDCGLQTKGPKDGEPKKDSKDSSKKTKRAPWKEAPKRGRGQFLSWKKTKKQVKPVLDDDSDVESSTEGSVDSFCCG